MHANNVINTEVMEFNRKKYSDETLLELYRAILLPRMIEEKMLLQLRLGKISKWFSGIGQEAISVGVTKAMEDDEYILPMHRNLGVFTSRNIPLDKLFMQLQGSYNGFSKGRERSFHFGTNDYHICGMISHLGPQLGIADGIALAELLRTRGHDPLSKKSKESLKITSVFSGDGGTSEGDFHESLNVAAVWDLPVIFIIENNAYGLSTPVNEQYACKALVDKAIGYGMEAYQIDGNNLLEVYDRILTLRSSMKKKPRPILIECMTFRMRGHEEASGVKYVPKELFEEWEIKDPVKNYEQYLIAEGLLDEAKIKAIREEYKEEIQTSLDKAFAQPKIKPDTSYELSDIYAPYTPVEVKPSSAQTEKRLVDAVSDGLKEAMKKFDNLVIMGQDVAEYGGVFKVTENFYKEFGKERVRNTPLCESAIVGAALGLSIKHYKAVMEMQFADFVTCGFNQIINNLAKIHYRWGQNADVVIRMPSGGGVGAGPFHSQSNEAWFTHTPGLKVVYPSNPYDAKGLLIASIEDPNPVMFFEHKALYRSTNGLVPDGYYNLPIGKARTALEGTDATIITYGMGVHWALDAAKDLDESVEVIDLRTLLPLDYNAISVSVKKTGKVIILHEDTLIGGIGGEIAAWISENLFTYLDAPVIRSASLDTPVPFAVELEQNFFPKERFKKQLEELLNY